MSLSPLIAGLPDWVVTSMILITSVIAFTIILERGYSLMHRLKLLDLDKEKVFLAHVEKGEYDMALSLAASEKHPAYRIAETILLARESTVDKKSLMDEAVMKELAGLERYLPTLGTVSTVAPLLGLLGTVTGMIKSFQAFETSASRSAQLMTGIDEALITTALGLVVGIPALIAYNYYVARANKLIDEATIMNEMVISAMGRKKDK